MSEGLFKENIAPIELWCAPDTTHEFFQYCASAYSVSLQRQWGNDLGERMENAFAQVLSNNKSAVIIGTDCPSISPAYLKSAFDCLEKSNAVIGPAEDGGYVLLGLRQLTSCIFHNMPWGQDQVLEKTIERLGREVIKLNTLWDIDYAKDVERLRETGTQIELAEDFKAHLSVLKLS